ncbi:MAG: Ig-like domain-containing protein [Desulfobacterales bacterium]
MKANLIKRTMWIGVFLLLGIVGYGCGSSGGLDDVGGGIVLTASTDIIPADGTSASVITATITTTGGVPITIGTQVTFSTTLGSINNSGPVYSVKTGNSTGTVTVSLTGTTEGKALVTCTAGGATQTVEVYIGTVSIASIGLTAEDASIVADGFDSTTITAEVTDSLGEPAEAGTTVVFTTNLGLFSSGSQVYSTVTNSDGTATATLFAGETAGSARISCEAGTVRAVTFVEFT